MPTNNAQPLPRHKVIFYSLTEIPLALALFPVLVYVPKYYGSNLGIDLAMVANVLLITRLLDVVTDPLIGYLSDRTKTRWGRRKPWIAAAAPVLMVSFYKLFVPPDDAGWMYLFGWMALMWTGLTMILIPYYAWAAELSDDYNERSYITGWRSAMGVVGSFLAQLLPTIAAAAFAFEGTRENLIVVAGTMLVLMPVCVLLSLSQVEEPKSNHSAQVPLIAGIKLMLSNGPFKRLVLTFMLGQTALSMTTPLYIFFIAFVLQAENNAVYMLLCFYTTNLLAIPFWVWLSKQIGKHRAYVCSFLLIASAHPFYLLLGAGDFWWMLPITIATGFSAGAFYALPNSMKADVIDLDTIKSGENRAALFFSTWSLTMKGGASLGGWIALYGLSLWGFDATPGGTNSPEQLFGLRFLFALLPSAFFVTAAAIVWKYPITEARHAEMRAELEQRNSNSAAGTLSV
ncbi:MAG: MFS transporter [Pseudomonadales bacterium]